MREQRPGFRTKMAALGLVLGWLWGCAGPSALEMDYGRSVRNNLAQQVINPRAGLEPTPAVGLDPKAGEYVLERYDKSFKEKEPPASAIPMITR